MFYCSSLESPLMGDCHAPSRHGVHDTAHQRSSSSSSSSATSASASSASSREPVASEPFMLTTVAPNYVKMTS